MPDEFRRPTVDRGNHRLAGAPGLEQCDAEGFVPAWNTDGIAGFIEVGQSPVSLKTEKPRSMRDPQLARALFDSCSHLPIAGKNKLGVRMKLHDIRNGFDKEVRSFLNDHAARKKHHRVHWTKARSEERRVGKECRARGAPQKDKKKTQESH